MNEQNQGTERLLIRMESRSQNEAFARAAVGAFMVRMDPTVEEIEDVKTAVSEAVSNSILHGYRMSQEKSGWSCSGRESDCELRLRITEKALRMFEKQGSRFIRPVRAVTVPGWASTSWKPLWRVWMWNHSRSRGRR